MQTTSFNFQKAIKANFSTETIHGRRSLVAMDYLFKGDAITCMFHIRRALFSFVKNFHKEELKKDIPNTTLSNLIKNKAFTTKIEELNRIFMNQNNIIKNQTILFSP